MVGQGMFNGILTMIVSWTIAITLAIVLLIGGVVWLFSSDEIKLEQPLEPTRIEIIQNKDKTVDTLYVYKID